MARLAGPVEPRPVCAAGHNEPPGCLHADVVNLAQQKNVNAGDAFDWYIDNLGRACLYNAVDVSAGGQKCYCKPMHIYLYNFPMSRTRYLRERVRYGVGG